MPPASPSSIQRGPAGCSRCSVATRSDGIGQLYRTVSTGPSTFPPIQRDALESSAADELSSACAQTPTAR